MAMLAVASLLIIPVMMRNSGAVAWGAVALGQAIGGVASVVVGFGWNMSGPAQIAGKSPTECRRQFVESFWARLSLFLPVALVAIFGAVASVAPANRGLAAMGAISSTAIGMSANWYFIGTIQPWTLLLTETVPRVAGTLAGMAAMESGGSALIGVAGQFAGMALGTVISFLWILRDLRNKGAVKERSRSPIPILSEQRDGVTASVSSAAIGALPVVLVAHTSPAAQPLFAFADKIQRQMAVALTPFVTVLQGWVPRGDRSARARQALFGGLLLCTLLAGAIFLFSPIITSILGGGVIRTNRTLNLEIAAFVGLGTYELILSHVILSTFERLRFVAYATLSMGILGLVLLIPGAIAFGAPGALAALLLAMALRCVLMAWDAYSVVNRPRPRRAAL